MTKGGRWIPAVCVRPDDQILYHGTASIVLQVARIGTGPKYLITTELGDLTVGAAEHIALLNRPSEGKLLNEHQDDHDDGPHGDPGQRRRRRAV